MILVIAAMQEEIKEITKSIQPNTHVIVTGVGKVNAAMRLTDMIQKERIEAIINVGFAGATKDYSIGDVVLIKQTKYHDFNLSMFGYAPGQVPGYPTYFESDKTWLKNIKKHLPYIKEGNLLTGDCFMTGDVEGHSLFDMEGTALYQVAHHFQIPIVSIKVVSDVIGMDDHVINYKKFEAEHGAVLLKNIYSILFGGQ